MHADLEVHHSFCGVERDPHCLQKRPSETDFNTKLVIPDPKLENITLTDEDRDSEEDKHPVVYTYP